MKKISVLLFLSVSLAALAQPVRIDVHNFLSRHDLIFDSLSTKWEEGAFLGNGLLGVMVYREAPDAIRFDLGRTDVTDHREGINPSIGKARLPIGKFVLRTNRTIKNIRLRLDLWNAELTGTLTTENETIPIRVLVPATMDIMLVQIPRNTKTDSYVIEWVPEPAISPFLTLGRDSAEKYEPNPPAEQKTSTGIHYHFQPLLAGGGFTTAWKNLVSEKQRSLVITITNSLVTTGSSKPGDANLLAGAILKGINAGKLDVLVNAHRQHWHVLYQRSAISIPDKRLEGFWWIQQYKMASATRPGARPIDLMGPWYHISPWPKYWWNLNIQLTYYPFFSSNHIDLVQPLMKMINANINHLAKNAPEPYQHNAAALGRSGPWDMSSGIKVLKGNDSTGNSPASLELGNLTWLLHVYWQAYEYTMDRNVMKNIYPVLTRAINYYIDIAQKETDGKYHLPYTYSPEYPKGITRDANYDLSVLRWGLKTLLLINQTLSLKDPLAAKWKDLLDNLTGYPEDDLGLRIGRDASFTQSHRHYSHLLMIYPIYDINWDQEEKRQLITRSLNQWKNNGGAWRGYSYTGSGSIYAMMGQGDSTWKLLNEMMKGRFSIKPNTMYTEAGPVIETPLSAVTTMNEMLLQSWGGVIRVFPAIPVSWKEASFEKLLARGAFELSAQRKNGKTEFIHIKSLAGTTCLVQTDWNGPVRATGKRIFKLTDKGHGLVSIDLKKGEEVILFTGVQPAAFMLKVAEGDGNNNYWGLKKKQISE